MQIKNSNEEVFRGIVNSDVPPTVLERVAAKIVALAVSPVSFVGNKLVFSKVQAGFGGRQKVIISGGSALSGKLEQFYKDAGIEISVGYGLTETSPLIAFRRTDANLKVSE